MKYYTAKEACDTFPHLMPSDVWTLRRLVKSGKFPIHDCMVKRGKKTLQAWSEHTILNWRTLARQVKVTKYPTAYAEGSVVVQRVKPRVKKKPTE